MVFDETKKAKFLATLMNSGSVKDACAAAGVSRSTAYDSKDSDDSFSRAWDEAKESLADDLQKEVKERALDREDKHAHTLLMFYLRALRPEFRDNFKTESKIIHEQVHTVDFSKEEKARAIQILEESIQGAGDGISRP